MDRKVVIIISMFTLFIIEDIIADESLDKRRQSLLEIYISGSNRNHCKITDDESNMIRDDELVIVCFFLKLQSKHVCK